MKLLTAARIITAGAAVGALGLATATVLEVRALHPKWFVHDSAFLLFYLRGITGGCVGTLVTWLLVKVFDKRLLDGLRVHDIGNAGCAGMGIAFIGFIFVVNLLLPWNP